MRDKGKCARLYSCMAVTTRYPIQTHILRPEHCFPLPCLFADHTSTHFAFTISARGRSSDFPYYTLPAFISRDFNTMVDQREHLPTPSVSGSSPADATDILETGHDASNEQREIDHLFDEGFTYETEQHEQSLYVDTENARRESSDNASQPGSAFSPDSSDEDADADDEGEEGDNDTEEYQADEWDNSSNNNEPDTSLPSSQRILPAVIGEYDRYHSEYYLLLEKVGPNGKRLHVPKYPRNDNVVTYKEKKDAHANAKDRLLRPSRLRTTSTPDSPESPSNKQSKNQFGVLPEPSPQADDQPLVSPLSDREADSRPKTALGHHRTPKSGWDWSSEEEDDDPNWHQKAIEDMKNPRKTSECGSSEDLPTVRNTEQDPVGSPDALIAPNDGPQLEDDEEALPVSPVSPLDPVDFFDQPNAVNETSEQSSQASNLPLSLRVGNPDSDAGDGTVALSQAHQDFSEDHHSVATAPEGFNPVFDNAHLRSPLPISPDLNEPELLTGLTPQEGVDSWREWHDRVRPGRFRTNRNPNNGDETGDLNAVDDTRDREGAVDLLSRRRFLIRKEARNENIRTTSDPENDHEASQEYLQLQMHRYRYQRNELYYQRNQLYNEREGLYYQRDGLSRDLEESEARVSRRDETIQDTQDRVARRDRRIEDLESENEETANHYCAISLQKDKLSEENKELGSALNACHRHGKALQAQLEDLSKQLAESQETCANWDNTRTELQAKIAELEERLIAVENDDSRKATKSRLQAKVEALRRKLQLGELQVELVACKAHGEQLQSRTDELEAEIGALVITQKANDSSASDLLDRLQAAEGLATDRQAIIEDLEAQLSAKNNELSDAQVLSSQANESYRGLEVNKDELQKELDESNAANKALQNDLDATRREVEALRKEVRLQREALLEHKQNPSSPSLVPRARSSNDRGTPRDNAIPPVLHEPQAETVPSPARPEQQDEVDAETTAEPTRWADRSRAILQQPSALKELESRRIAREKRQAEERERLAQIERRLWACLEVDELPDVPVEDWFL